MGFEAEKSHRFDSIEPTWELSVKADRALCVKQLMKWANFYANEGGTAENTTPFRPFKGQNGVFYLI